MDKDKIVKFISKLLLVVIFFVLVILFLINFELIRLSDNINPLAIVLNKTEIGVKLGDNYQLEATVFPRKKQHGDIRWYSSDDSVASVNEITGYIETHKKGTAIIKAKQSVNELETECVVNVTGDEIIAKSVDFFSDKLFMSVGDSYKLSYSLSPSNSNMDDFSFISSDNSIVLVNGNGVVRSLKPGKAIITIISKINNISDSLVVEVYDASNIYSDDVENYAYNINYSKTKELILSQQNINLNIGYATRISSSVFPKSANQNINWISTNPSVAMVDSDGIVTALKEGITTIVATTIDGIASSCEVNVLKNDSSKKVLDILDNEINLLEQEQNKIKYSLMLTPIELNSINWSSSNNEVAVVNNGIITAKKVGECLITVKSSNGKYSDSVKVKVSSNESALNIQQLSFDKSEYTLSIGNTITLTPNVVPKNFWLSDLKWESSNSSVAKVNNGVVNCLREGNAVITVSNGNISANVNVIVKKLEPSLIEFDVGEQISVPVGISKYLIKKVIPVSATNQAINWKSSDSSVVSVNNNGLIQTRKKGTAIITVKSLNGVSSSIKINVI